MRQLSGPSIALMRRGAERASEVRRPVVVAWTETLAEEPKLGSLYDAAERAGERRFLAKRPEAGAQLLALGCAMELRLAKPSGPESLTPAVQELFADAVLAEGARPVLVGGFAFEPRPGVQSDPAWRPFGNGLLTLPEILLSYRVGEWRACGALSLGPGEDPDQASRRWLAQRQRGAPAPQRRPSCQLSSPHPDALCERYAAVAEQLIDSIRAGAARKVVLADVERLHVRGRIPTVEVLETLSAAHPACMTFAQGLGSTCFAGATPERLIEIEGDRVRASAVAGTRARSQDPVADERGLQGSSKDRVEHAFVVEALAEAMRERCAEVEIPAEPRPLRTGNAIHLHTEIVGRVTSGVHLLDLLGGVHPTPAVAGTPRRDALELIRKHERFDRGWYAGPIGWLDSAGDGQFHLALRCGLLRPQEARLFAGAGLVAASDPRREAAETRLKLGALRAALEAVCAS